MIECAARATEETLQVIGRGISWLDFDGVAIAALADFDEGGEEIRHTIAKLLHIGVLVGGAFVAVNGDTLMHLIAIEIELLAERFHDQLLQVFRHQAQRIFVRQDDHVLFAFAIAAVEPRKCEAHRGIVFDILLASLSIHGSGTREHCIDIDPLQRGRHKANRREHTGATTDPVFHREAGDESLRNCVLTQLRAFAGDGHGVFAKIEPRRLVSRLGLDHAIAGFGCATRFRNHQHKGIGEIVLSDRCQYAIDAIGVSIVEEMNRHACIVADGFRNKLRTESRATDADDQEALEIATSRIFHHGTVHISGELFQCSKWLGDLRAQGVVRCEGRIAQPVMTDHASFVRIGNGSAFECDHVSKCFVDLTLHGLIKIRRDVHARGVEGKSVCGVTEQFCRESVKCHNAASKSPSSPKVKPQCGKNVA